MHARVTVGIVLSGLAAAATAAAGEGKTTSTGIWIHGRATEMRGLPLGPFVRLPDSFGIGSKLLTVDAPQDVLTSADDGKTWERTPLFPGPAQYDFRPERALLCTRSGVLILAFENKQDSANWNWDPKIFDAPGAKRPTYVTRSLDRGRIWQPPQKLHDDWTGALRDIIQTRKGTVVFTSMMMRHDPGRHTVLTYSSADDGLSWRRSNIIDLGGRGHHAGTIEGTLEELRDGRLWMLLRTNRKVFWEAFSSDDGLSWPTVRPSTIDASSSPGLLKRLQSGRLLLIWNRYYPEGQQSFPLRGGGDDDFAEVPVSVHRLELSAMLSEDEGRTWTKPVVIAKVKRGGLAYPYLFEIRPGELWITTMYGTLRLKLLERDLLD